MILVAAILTFLWDSSPGATFYTLYEKTSIGWQQRGQTAQAQMTLSVPKGLRTFAVSASNPYGESALSIPLTYRVKGR